VTGPSPAVLILELALRFGLPDAVVVDDVGLVAELSITQLSGIVVVVVVVGAVLSVAALSVVAAVPSAVVPSAAVDPSAMVSSVDPRAVTLLASVSVVSESPSPPAQTITSNAAPTIAISEMSKTMICRNCTPQMVVTASRRVRNPVGQRGFRRLGETWSPPRPCPWGALPEDGVQPGHGRACCRIERQTPSWSRGTVELRRDGTPGDKRVASSAIGHRGRA